MNKITIIKKQNQPVKINPKTNVIENTTYCPSPNNDDRPNNTAIDLLVIHSISLPPGEYGGPWIEKLFTNQLPPDEHPYFETIKHLNVSSHILIRRDGNIIQFVPFNKRAWHAGESSYEGREQCNDFSIGIELEGTDTSEFETVQYEQLAQLIRCLDSTYDSISSDRLTGHSDIAPDRKTDPGTGFNWDTLNTLLKS